MSRHQNNSSLGFLFGGADTRPKVSANTFATGSNQNCGNFITDRSTVRFSRKTLHHSKTNHMYTQTRVHAPPGGRSQISIFGGYAETEKKRVKKTETAPSTSVSIVKKGTSANAFATGSNQNCGNFITDRSTTRIHAPPGGRTSISIFGGYAEESKKATPVVSKPLVETKKDNVPAPTVVKTASPIKTARHVSSNKFATGSNQNCGNFITDRPTTRVHAPPGGRSQITFG